jgi:hypothetical protein
MSNLIIWKASEANPTKYVLGLPMSQWGQKRRFEVLPKTSGLSLVNGHCQTGPVGPVRADIVAKVFLRC